jgi:thymidylate synthase
MEANNTCIFAKNAIHEILNRGVNAKKKVGNWCLKKDGSANVLERYSLNMTLKHPQNCITSQHTLACEIETEDYLLGLNPGFVEYSDWGFYRKFKREDGTYHYTYGERLKNIINATMEKAKNDKTSRQLVISIWNNVMDITENFVPCNVLMKLDISSDKYNRDKLNMFVVNRSQDMCRGFFLDSFAYPMLQQVICNNYGYKLGKYYHYIMNAHIYEDDTEFAENILSNLRNEKPLEIPDKLTEYECKIMKEISGLIFASGERNRTQSAQFLAKKLPDFWYNWKANQIVYAYSKYVKKDPMPTSITCVGVVINENPRKL